MSRLIRVSAVCALAGMVGVGAVSALAAPIVTAPVSAVRSAPALATAADPGDIPGVPVYAQMLTTGVRTDGSPAVISAHGVQRVPGGTIVYYSVGFPEGAQTGSGQDSDPRTAMIRSLGGNLNLYGQGQQLGAHCDVAVIDQAGGQMYAPLPDAQSRPAGELCSERPFSQELGEARVTAVALAEMPDDVDVVDVAIRGVLLPAVPVGEGQLEPFAEPERQLGPLVGMGWPELDLTAIAAADGSERIYPLGHLTQDLEGEISETQTTLELSGDVLFEIDSADIDASGREVLDRAIEQLRELEVSGTLLVVGHTDNVGGARYNQDLSERRAESVARVLRSELGSSVTIETEGRGYDDPIASNDTDSGKALNRRVTLDYTTGNQ